MLERLNLIPNLICKRHLVYAWTLFGVEKEDILCIAGSKSLVFTRCALDVINDDDIINYAVLTDHKQFIEELRLRGIASRVDLTSYGLAEVFPPQKLIHAITG